MNDTPDPTKQSAPPELMEVDLPRRVTPPTGPLDLIPEPVHLAHARPADGGVFRLAGRRAALHLQGTGGVAALAGDGEPILEGLRVGAGANLLVGPRSYRRELVVGGVPVMEAGVVPELLPGAVLQWWTSGPSEEFEFTLEAVLPLAGAPDGTVQIHRDGPLLWLARSGTGVLLQIVPPHDAPEIPAPRLDLHPRGVRLRWRLPLTAGVPLSLLVQNAPPEGSWTHLRPLAGVTAHHRRGEDAAVGKDEPGIVLLTGVPALDEGTSRARTFLRHGLLKVPGRGSTLHGPTLDPLTPARIARAAAASGEWEMGRAALSRLSSDSARQRLAAGAARASWLLWTGEKDPLREGEADLLKLFRDAGAVASLDREEVEHARRMIRSAAEAAEREELLGVLEGPAGARPARGGLSLPMAGGGSSGHTGRSEGGNSVSEGPGADGLVNPLFSFARGDRTPEERLAESARWRTAVDRIADDPAHLDPEVASHALLGLVEGLLGARSDAAVGRLSLCPILPANWTRFRIEGLRAGEGTVELSWERNGDEMLWEIAPRIGSVPITVIFEPWFPCPAVTDLRMDGEPAELDSASQDGWCRVQVQLPADGHRTLSARAVATPR